MIIKPSENTRWLVVCGDVRSVLARARDQSVHCVITSTPYWKLRDYGLPPLLWGGSDECEHEWGGEIVTDTRGTQIGKAVTVDAREAARGQFCRLCGCWRGSLGLEPTPELYIEHLVGIFREVRRVLRDDGTFWCNIAGCYAGAGDRRGGKGDEHGQMKKWATPSESIGLKPKDWVPIPWMLGMALQQDGWWLRSPIIWAKGVSFCPTYSGSCMPESVRDRPTTSYEHLLLLAKKRRYFYDQKAVREPSLTPGDNRAIRTDNTQTHARFGGTDSRKRTGKPTRTTRNLRSVWTINPRPFKEAHFATFPPALVEPCIKAGTSERGCCPECGKPWERVTKRERPPISSRRRKDAALDTPGNPQYRGGSHSSGLAEDAFYLVSTVGWRPRCRCYDHLYRTQYPKARRARKRRQRDAWSGGWWKRVRKRPGKDCWQVEPCIVLDPFSGSGTAVMVALQLGRRAVGIDLNESYCAMARKRIVENVDPNLR